MRDGMLEARVPKCQAAPMLRTLLSVCLVLAVLWLMLRLESEEGTGSAGFAATAGFDPDDAMLVVPLAMAAGGAEVLLMCATLGAPLAAVAVWWTLRRRRTHGAGAGEVRKILAGRDTSDRGPSGATR